MSKTKFLLHGGMLKYKDERNKTYFQELTKDLSDGDKVLFIGFARPDLEDRQQVYERDKEYIVSNSNISVDVVNATQENLLEQLAQAKAVHVTGGETDQLVQIMRGFPEFKKLVEGKTVGGSSAGACMLCEYYYFSSTDSVLEGLGLLPIKVLVHYGSSEYKANDEAVKKLEVVPGNLEVLKLEECAWVKREVEL